MEKTIQGKGSTFRCIWTVFYLRVCRKRFSGIWEENTAEIFTAMNSLPSSGEWFFLKEINEDVQEEFQRVGKATGKWKVQVQIKEKENI